MMGIALTEEKLEFTRTFLLWANLALLAWIFLAFFGMWFYSELYGWLLVAFTAATVYMILRRVGCSSCYYCKTCTSGFGRLAGSFFGRGFTKKSSVGNRTGFVAFIYFLLAPLPAFFLILSTAQTFSILKVAVLAGLITVTVYSVSTWMRKRPINLKTSEA